MGVGGTRLRTLLILLLLRPGRSVAVEELIDTIWGEDVPTVAGNALQALVSRLRRSLGTEVPLFGDGTGYRLEITSEQVDMHVFEELAAQGRAELTAGRAAAAEHVLSEALGLWHGPALPDLTSRGLAEDVSSRLAQIHRTVEEDLLEALVLLGRTAEALPKAEALVALDPHRERPVELLVRALAGSGRTADALAVHKEFRTRLAEDLGLDPSPRSRRLHLDLLRGKLAPSERDEAAPRERERTGGPATSPARARARESAPALRIPRHLTDFVAREAEVGATVDRLSSTRMVTLTGPGGAGKTRLGSESATILAERDPSLVSGGLWWVELAPIRQGADLPETVASALGPREFAVLNTRTGSAHRPPVERIAAQLGEHPCLVVLDNCEHLVEAVARFVESLLARCPGLRVLATSREPIKVPGEVLLPVPSLESPPEGAEVDQALACSAVELFTARAEAARPGFRLTPDNVAHVIRITRELDGMPLALELAAARLRVMSPAQLAHRLTDRFRLLTDGDRTVLPRHRTLRAVVDWSWELLDEPERRLLRRLAVFPGGAILEAVEEVGSDPDDEVGRVGGRDVWTVLFALVDKSLVVAENPAREDDPPIYRQLETVRAYTMERLARSGEQERVRSTHARHVVDLWRRADPELRGPGQRSWLARLGARTDDCVAAFNLALERRDLDLALDLVEYTQWYWTLAGSWRQIHAWAGQTLDLVGEQVPSGRESAYAACLFHRAGGMESGREALLERLDRVEEVLEAGGVQSESHPVFISCLIYRAMIDGDPSGDARRRVEDALEQPKDTWSRALIHLMASLLDSLFGQASRSRERAEVALEGMRACGDVWGQCNALVQLVDVNVATDLERCLRLLGEGIDLAEGAGLHELGVLFRTLRAQSQVELGRSAQAEAELDRLEGVTMEDETRVALRMTRIMWLQATGDLMGARRLLDESGALVWGLGGFAPVYLGPSWLAMAAEVAWAEGDHERAWREAGRSWWVSLRGAALSGVGALEVLAGLEVENDPAHAAVLLGYSASLRGAANTALPRVRRLRERLRDALGEAEADHLMARGAGTPQTRLRESVGRWLAPIVPEDVEAGDRSQDP